VNRQKNKSTHFSTFFCHSFAGKWGRPKNNSGYDGA
jgi:hypothetical protein